MTNQVPMTYGKFIYTFDSIKGEAYKIIENNNLNIFFVLSKCHPRPDRGSKILLSIFALTQGDPQMIAHRTFPARLAGIILVLALILTPLSSALAAPAATNRYVSITTGSDTGNNCSNSASPCRTITRSIYQSISGDVVYLAQGTYPERLTLIAADLTFDGGWNNTFSARVADAALTVVDGSAGGPVWNILGANTFITLQNLTVQNGRYAGGGGITATGAGGVTLNGVMVQNNTTTLGGNGGGIYINLTDLTVSDSTFSGNSAGSNGGAIYMSPGKTVLIVNTGFSNNSTTGGTSFGGAIMGSANTALTIRNNSFTNNSSSSGGAVYLQNQTIVAAIERNYVYNNSATTAGAGFAFSNSNATLTNNVVAGHIGGDGVGVYSELSSDLNLLHNTFAYNTVGLAANVAGVNIVGANNAITHNSVGVAASSGNNVTLNRTELYLNAANSGGAGIVNFVDSATSGDTKYTNGPGGNFYPQQGSSLQNTGLNAGVTVDKVGSARPQGAGFEIGAYEVQDAPTAVTVASFESVCGGLRWSTASEHDAIGFNIWSGGVEPVQKLNSKIIPASSMGGVSGADYFFATSLNPDKFYWLEGVSVDGNQMFGPVAGVQVCKIFAPLVVR